MPDPALPCLSCGAPTEPLVIRGLRVRRYRFCDACRPDVVGQAVKLIATALTGGPTRLPPLDVEGREDLAGMDARDREYERDCARARKEVA